MCQSNKRFFVSKKIVEETIRKIKNRDEQVIAVYHPHPTTAPVPSFYDVSNHPDDHLDMVIISYKTRPPITKWYHIKGANFEACPFWIEPSPQPELFCE
ncbi:Mov34/MPN/PAD-1 family protein [Oceanobacillus sp. CF4.6]|uniref:Mov34/MPN/PAD-1 family protein n=1 Tax=Oceanobacillus sp. CF4.6 TaxID=3373080 RepID=UPI003EE6AA12